MAETETKYIYVKAANAKVFVEGVLIGNGVPAANAAIIADCLVQADMRGVDTQWVIFPLNPSHNSPLTCK